MHGMQVGGSGYCGGIGGLGGGASDSIVITPQFKLTQEEPSYT